MTSPFKIPEIYRVFFKAELAAVRKRRADYDAEVADWYESGDGRERHYVEHEVTWTMPDGELVHDVRHVNVGGKGYRFPHCIHGTSLWTDYDNICGGCEESLTELQEARGYARERWLRFIDRWDWANAAPGDLDYDTRTDLLKWAYSLYPKKEN